MPRTCFSCAANLSELCSKNTQLLKEEHMHGLSFYSVSSSGSQSGFPRPAAAAELAETEALGWGRQSVFSQTAPGMHMVLGFKNHGFTHLVVYFSLGSG